MTGGRLYLVNGDAAGDLLEAAGLAAPDEILVLRDVLSCGPLGDQTLWADPEAWRAMREGFWSRLWHSADRIRGAADAFEDVLALPRNVYDAGPRLRAARELIVCTGAGLSDVLAGGFFVAWAGALGRRAGVLHQLRLQGLDTPPIGLPHLTPSALARAWRVEPMDERRRTSALAFWQAFASAQPEGTPPPGQAAAEQALAYKAWRARHPSPERPLAAWDAQLLGAAAGGATSLMAVLVATMKATVSSPDPVGDLVLLHRIAMLAAEAPGPSLLELGAGEGHDRSCALTEAGHAALAGQADPATFARRTAWARGLA